VPSTGGAKSFGCSIGLSPGAVFFIGFFQSSYFTRFRFMWCVSVCEVLCECEVCVVIRELDHLILKL
jgi:hypothetical protein